MVKHVKYFQPYLALIKTAVFNYQHYVYSDVMWLINNVKYILKLKMCFTFNINLHSTFERSIEAWTLCKLVSDFDIVYLLY